MRGKQREGMEQARLIAYFSKAHIEGTRLSLDRLAIFPWENESDYAPRFDKVNPEAFARIDAWQFPDKINDN